MSPRVQATATTANAQTRNSGSPVFQNVVRIEPTTKNVPVKSVRPSL